jgi:E3 ubiquitin-protein ligase RAD18
LSNDGRCPACRATDQELKLRSNSAIEELVEAFKKARPGVLYHARNSAASAGGTSPKRKLDGVDVDGEDGEQPRKRTRSSGRIANISAEQIMVLNVEEDDADYKPEDGLVTGPICKARVKYETINPHLDKCNGEPPETKHSLNKTSGGRLQSPSTATSEPAKRPDRLPHLSYSIFKDNALRKKLGELGISSIGSRQLLERRHTEWITLWNANCDSSKPRKKVELLHELDIWERTQGGRAPSSNSALNAGSQLMNKDFDSAAWSSKHDDSFQQLIARARRKPLVETSSLEPQTLTKTEGNDQYNIENADPLPTGDQSNVRAVAVPDQGGEEESSHSDHGQHESRYFGKDDFPLRDFDSSAPLPSS